MINGIRKGFSTNTADILKKAKNLIASLDAVEAVRRVQEPYKKANRKFHPEETIVNVDGVPVGGNLEYADEVTLQRALDGRNEI